MDSLEKKIFYIQNISGLLDVLETEIKEMELKLNRKQREQVFLYLIGKTLFKSGKLNTVYPSIWELDHQYQKIRSSLINGTTHRYLPNLIFDNIQLPRLRAFTSGEEIFLGLIGDLLFMKS